VPVIRRINHFRKNDFDHEPMIDFGPLGWIAYRAVNKFSRSTLGNRIGRESKPVSRYVKERFTGRYAESNRRLQEYSSADLTKLGYPLAQ